MRFAGKTVVVTGAGGFIGSHVVERLVREGATVRAVLRYTSRGQRGALDLVPADVMEAVELTLGDVRDFDAVREVMRGADAMLHLAALVGIPYSYEHPQEVIDTNVVGTSNVLLAAKELGSLERVVLTSTSEVYGSALRVPMDEEHPLQAQSPYSATKIAADALGQSFQRSFGIPVTIIRPFNAYGPRQSARAVIPTIIAQAVSGSALKLGSVATTRDFTFVEDTAQAFLQIGASDAAVGEVVNAGSGREIAISDVVKKVAEITDRELDVETDAQRVRPEASEVSRLLSDSSKAERLAGWRAETSLDDGLRRTVDWIGEHIDLYRPDEYAV
ncbi:MAG: SDR family NAD(P)-dependent oxidoreductase [Acidimicrobiia bacterium]